MAAVPAFAQPAPAPPPTSGVAELGAGDKAARSKDWAGALVHFQASLQATLDPKAQLHAQLGVADALYQLGRLGEAYEAYDEVQRTAPRLARGDRTLVAARLKDLATKTGALSLHVEEAGAEVVLDGKPLGTSPLAALTRVATGSHEVRVTKAGFVPFVARAEVAPDARATVDVTLVREATQGHLVIQSFGPEPLRVLVDGVDLGATPWEGDVRAGPHEITGRSSTAVTSPQTVTVNAGQRAQITLVGATTTAHVQVRTSDGKGLVYLDGVIKGEGAFEGDTPAGPHTVVVSREGYDRFEKALTLGPRETWAETVTLHPTVAANTAASEEPVERPFQGVYGGFGFAGLAGINGQGTELETSCGNLGATSCDTPKPLGGGALGYVGYTWDPVGFELFLAGSGDTAAQSAHFNGTSEQFSNLVGDEKFRFVRFGGEVALRVRATASWGSAVRGTIAGGVGLSVKAMEMARTSTATGTTGRDLYVPSLLTYISPAISTEASIQLRATPTIAISIGLLMWADNASIAGSALAPSASGRSLYSTSGAPKPIETPQYHLASGPQVFLGPQIGMQFGP